jgi:hypothetical protein
MQLRQEEAVEIRAAMALRPQTKKSNDCRSIDGGAGFGKEGSGSRKGSSSVTRSDRSNSGTAANSSSSSSSRDTAVQNGALDRATSRPRSALSDATHLAAEAPVISSPSTPPSTPQQPPSQTSSSSSPLTRPPLEDWLAEICGLSRNNSSTETGSTKAVAVAVLRWAYIAITVFAFALLFEVVNRHAETLWCDDGGHDSAQLAAVIAAAHDNKPTQLRPSEEALATITNAVTTIVQPLHDLVMDGVSWAAVTPLLLLAYLAGRFTPN